MSLEKQKWDVANDISKISDKERDDALEYFMRRCSTLEEQVKVLKERVERLTWTLEEHD